MMEHLLAEMKAIHEKTDARSIELDAQHERMMACLGKMETTNLKVNPGEMMPIAEHWELPKDDAVVKSCGAMMKRHRGWNLAAGHSREPKEQTQENCGSQKKLDAAHRGKIRHAGVARHKGHIIGKNETTDKVARGTQKGRTLRKRQLMCQEGINGTKNRDFKEQLCLELRGDPVGSTGRLPGSR
jgi:hypothetical protein